MRLVNDPIHGHILFDEFIWKIIDSPHFQRLGEIRQMDTTSFVFRGATHTRLAHSLGVAHLAKEMAKSIQERQPELGITDADIRAVQLAGLCHDLGHGPFSHLFDHGFMSIAKPELGWTHESASAMMFEDLINSQNIDLDKVQVKFVQDLIKGDSSGYEKKFLFDIVANHRNSCDVDKFDYINRDCHFLGLFNKFDSSRLIHWSRVIDNEICYPVKEAFNLFELFHTRFTLFKKAYTHKTSHAIELMIVDILLAADKVLQISNSVENASDFMKMTDQILSLIEYSSNPELTEAQNILHRIRERSLYRLLGEYYIPEFLSLDTNLVISHFDKILLEYDLNVSDLKIAFVKCNHGFGNRNPLDHIKFYSKSDLSHSFTLKPEQVSGCMPQKYQETRLRIYLKDLSKGDIAIRALQEFEHQSLPKSVINLYA